MSAPSSESTSVRTSRLEVLVLIVIGLVLITVSRVMGKSNWQEELPYDLGIACLILASVDFGIRRQTRRLNEQLERRAESRREDLLAEINYTDLTDEKNLYLWRREIANSSEYTEEESRAMLDWLDTQRELALDVDTWFEEMRHDLEARDTWRQVVRSDEDYSERSKQRILRAIDDLDKARNDGEKQDKAKLSFRIAFMRAMMESFEKESNKA
jgi:hypothetical protein